MISKVLLSVVLLEYVVSSYAFVFPRGRHFVPRLKLSSAQSEDAEVVGQSETGLAIPDGTEAEDAVSEVSVMDKRVVSLIEDDEWSGLSMELGTLITTAVREDLKKSARDFIGKDEYAFGDLTKEVDARVKAEVARLRDKDDYELGDFSLLLDQVVKDTVCEYVGKDAGEYEFGDLSIQIDKTVKQSVATFCGKEQYEVGDLSREVAARVSQVAADFAGNDTYEFGDVSKELNRRREVWVKDFIGDKEYEFGDVTKKAVANFTGKDEYEFGDVTKKVLGGFEKFLGGNKPTDKK